MGSLKKTKNSSPTMWGQGQQQSWGQPPAGGQQSSWGQSQPQSSYQQGGAQQSWGQPQSSYQPAGGQQSSWGQAQPQSSYQQGGGQSSWGQQPGAQQWNQPGNQSTGQWGAQGSNQWQNTGSNQWQQSYTAPPPTAGTNWNQTQQPHGSTAKQQNQGGAKVYYAHGQRLGLSPPEVDFAVQQFYRFDADRSGAIEFRELEQILGTLMGHKMKPALISRLAAMHFNEADRDKSGQIDMQEFLEIYSKLKRAH